MAPDTVLKSVSILPKTSWSSHHPNNILWMSDTHIAHYSLPVSSQWRIQTKKHTTCALFCDILDLLWYLRNTKVLYYSDSTYISVCSDYVTYCKKLLRGCIIATMTLKWHIAGSYYSHYVRYATQHFTDMYNHWKCCSI